jgi:hypothetical protein
MATVLSGLSNRYGDEPPNFLRAFLNYLVPALLVLSIEAFALRGRISKAKS